MSSRSNVRIGAGLALLALAFVACMNDAAAAGSAEGSCEHATGVPDRSTAGIASAEADFGEALFEALGRAQPRQTVLISPLSVSTALALTGTGAEGKTRTEFETVLGLGRHGLTLKDVAERQSDRRRALEPCAGTRFELANSIWAADDFRLNAPFVERQRSLFDAEIQSVNFRSPATLSLVNGWVSRKTAGKIPMVLNQIAPTTRLLLINALHFKGGWQRPFDKTQTKPLDFKLAGGTSVRVPGMHRVTTLSYLDNASFQAVVLPFNDPRYEMVVVLPHKVGETAAPAGGLSHVLDSAGFSQSIVTLTMPRMRLSWDGRLAKTLQLLGLESPFGNADFSGWSSQAVRIDEVIHKVSFEADEAGAEGAAATVVVVMPMGVLHRPELQHVEMIVDRPYYILVRERGTGTILFMGFVADPGTRL